MVQHHTNCSTGYYHMALSFRPSHIPVSRASHGLPEDKGEQYRQEGQNPASQSLRPCDRLVHHFSPTTINACRIALMVSPREGIRSFAFCSVKCFDPCHDEGGRQWQCDPPSLQDQEEEPESDTVPEHSLPVWPKRIRYWLIYDEDGPAEVRDGSDSQSSGQQSRHNAPSQICLSFHSLSPE